MRTGVCVGLMVIAATTTPVGDGVSAAQSSPASSGWETQYRPPAEHPAPRRIGGSSRSSAPSLPTIAVLAPDHLGLTGSEQPRLYWFISAPTSARLELTLIQPGVEAPLFESVLPGATAGIHPVDLRRLGVRLVAGVEYEWSIALVTDPAQRSRDIVSGGAIMRIQTSGGDTIDAAEYARRGLWHDALMALDRGEGGQPAAALAREQRAALLEQAGLTEVVVFERR